MSQVAASGARETMSTREACRLVSEALADDRLALAFQPVVNAERSVAFHEGLIRIFDRDNALVPAGRFIAAVEEQDLGRRLDLAALEKGLAALEAHPPMRLSINMSVRTIGDARWMRCLEAAVERQPTLAERLIVEITERTAILAPDVGPFMSKLRKLGIAFALDDFGAGYTSFRHLKELHFDIIKIDGGFIRGIDRDVGNQVMTRALLSVAAYFETLAVAECVESPGEAAMLRNLGVDCMQGWLFGRPALQPFAPAVPARALLAG